MDTKTALATMQKAIKHRVAPQRPGGGPAPMALAPRGPSDDGPLAYSFCLDADAEATANVVALMHRQIGHNLSAAEKTSIRDAAYDAQLDQNLNTLKSIAFASRATLEPPEANAESLVAAIQRAGVTDVPTIVAYIQKHAPKGQAATLIERVLKLLNGQPQGQPVAAVAKRGQPKKEKSRDVTLIQPAKPHDPSRHEAYDPLAQRPSTAKPSPAKVASGSRGVGPGRRPGNVSASLSQGIYLSLAGGTWRQSN